MRREQAPALRLVGNNGIAAKSSWGFAFGLSGGQPLRIGQGRGALALPIWLVLPWIVGGGFPDAPHEKGYKDATGCQAYETSKNNRQGGFSLAELRRA